MPQAPLRPPSYFGEACAPSGPVVAKGSVAISLAAAQQQRTPSLPASNFYTVVGSGLAVLVSILE